MKDALQTETELAAALRLTADPPQAWIDAAALIPGTLGDLDAIEEVIGSAEFREQFAADPRGAITNAGLTFTEPLIAALRDRLSS